MMEIYSEDHDGKIHEKSSKGQSSENLAARSIGLIHNLANNFTRDTKNKQNSCHEWSCDQL